MAAVVHDMGKIAIPVELLCKPGRLNDIERMLIQQHPEASRSILSDIQFPYPVADLAYQHHERKNGSGYPLGLSDDQILPGAKIIGVADVAEAMVSHRPYRPSLGIEAAICELQSNRSRLYDALVVDACIKLLRTHAFSDWAEPHKTAA